MYIIKIMRSFSKDKVSFVDFGVVCHEKYNDNNKNI